MPMVSCCLNGYSGNTDCSEDGRRNLNDITRLIDRVYVSKTELCCIAEGNVDGDPDEDLDGVPGDIIAIHK